MPHLPATVSRFSPTYRAMTSGACRSWASQSPGWRTFSALSRLYSNSRTKQTGFQSCWPRRYSAKGCTPDLFRRSMTRNTGCRCACVLWPVVPAMAEAALVGMPLVCISGQQSSSLVSGAEGSAVSSENERLPSVETCLELAGTTPCNLRLPVSLFGSGACGPGILVGKHRRTRGNGVRWGGRRKRATDTCIFLSTRSKCWSLAHIIIAM